MTRVFADTFYFLALLIEDDMAHEWAVRNSQESNLRLVTTDWVLLELGDALSGEGDKKTFTDFVDFLRNHSDVSIVRATSSDFDEGLDLFRNRRDKGWTLTDCISFRIMHRLDLSDCLTGDHHFAQAGYRVLFGD